MKSLKEIKEEVIKAAYGDMWSKLSENQQNYALKNNGTITFDPSYGNGTPELLSDLWDYFSKNGDKLDDQDYGNESRSFHTPMSLKGIEDNNGWINVKDELPKENGKFWVRYKGTPLSSESKVECFYVNKGWDSFLEVSQYRPYVEPPKPLY